MKQARVISYGTIPIHHSPNGPRVLVVEQYGAQGTHWGFPKGGPVAGETPLETAMRETREETGLSFSEIIDEAQFTVNYSFTFEDTLVNKTVMYFIGIVVQPGLALRESEIKNGRWCTFEEARNQLSFMNTKDMFDAALVYLKEHHDAF